MKTNSGNAMKDEPVHILSLGAGVQSSTLALMAARGEVTPMPDAAIFADTRGEPKAIYKWLYWLEKQLPFPVHVVSAGSLAQKALRMKYNKEGFPKLSNIIPAFIKNPNGSRGILPRRCTSKFKIIPILKKSRELGGIKRGLKEVGVVQWIGISLDEIYRMKPSRDPWCRNRWPLIEKEMSRHDCLLWMRRNGFPTPPRSACVFCPFRSDNEWRWLKTNDPSSFAYAIRFEKKLQKLHWRTCTIETVGRVGVPFLHDSLKPLGEIDFSEDTTQAQFRFVNECEGMCGV